jgi:hypothetical protein
MDYVIEELDLVSKLDELHLALPEKLSFGPENLESVGIKDDFVFAESVVDLGKLFKSNGIEVGFLGGDTELYRARKNADIYLPAIFFGISQITENPTIVSVALNVLSSYVFDFFKGGFGRKTAHIEFYLETKEKGIVKKLSYKGDAEGLKNLDKVIKSLR